LTALEVELENHRRNLQQPAKEPSGQASAELQSLRQQIEMLKQQQIASSSQTGAREENIEREVFLLQQQMRQKDTEIGKLQSQLHSLDSDLSIKHKELESKQEYVDKLSSELQDLRTQSVATRALDLTRDDAENTEKMRQQIVSLAKALERSEGRRALVIERLEGERQANADSLRRLTESVKRFYGTLSMGES
jgi:chromosome segregation ATPase